MLNIYYLDFYEHSYEFLVGCIHNFGKHVKNIEPMRLPTFAH